MHETVVKAQTYLLEQKFIVVAGDGEIVGEETFVDSFCKTEMQEDVFATENMVMSKNPLKHEKKQDTKKIVAKELETVVPVQKTHKSIEEEEDEKIAQFFNITCDKCPNLTFPKFGTLRTHMLSEHRKQWAYVTCCNIKLDKRHKLLEHIIYHQEPEKFKCPECSRQFTSMFKVQNHQKTMHEPKIQLKHECRKCGKRFLKGCSLKIHMVVHLTKEERDAQKTLICNECENRFTSKYKLEQHMKQVHLNMNLYVCEICAKVYKTKTQYRYHHTTAHCAEPQPKAQCPLCKNFYLNEECVKKHIQHIHSEKKNHVCDVCGKVSLNIRAMRSHKRYMHQYERKFVCKICSKAFKKADALKEHMTIHLGGTLYSCLFCDRTFNSKANMYNHRKSLHPVELEKLKEEKQKKDLRK